MQSLLPLAEKVGARLKARGENIAVAESSVGGLISAALLAVPGASAYFLGGAIVYTRQSREALLGIPASALEGVRPATEPYALLLARTVRQKFSANWASARPAPRAPPATATATARVTPASRWSAPASTRSRSR